MIKKKMKIKELLKKKNENRLIIIIGLFIIILIIVGWGIDKILINKAIDEREIKIVLSKEISACQKGCNNMFNIIPNELNKNISVFNCLEYCNRHYDE